MQRTRRRDTSPELAIRRLVHAEGLRYRVDARPLPGLNRRADLVFSAVRVAVFIDGCFWHGCPLHHTSAKQNAQFWADKVSANRRRDQETDAVLRAAGWKVLRAWEHEDPAEVAERVRRLVRGERNSQR